jgi:hypothetical protein
MLTQKSMIAACLGVMGAALLSGNANAMTEEECLRLSPNLYLAAIERGACGIDDIETAAGPQQEAASNENGGRDGRNGGRDGGGKDGGGNDGGGNDGGGGGRQGGGNPAGSGRPGAKP